MTPNKTQPQGIFKIDSNFKPLYIYHQNFNVIKDQEPVNYLAVITLDKKQNLIELNYRVRLPNLQKIKPSTTKKLIKSTLAIENFKKQIEETIKTIHLTNINFQLTNNITEIPTNEKPTTITFTGKESLKTILKKIEESNLFNITKHPLESIAQN